MKSASRIVGAVGVFTVLLAIVMRLMVGSPIHILGIDTCASHLLLVANSLLLIALLLRTQEPFEKK